VASLQENEQRINELFADLLGTDAIEPETEADERTGLVFTREDGTSYHPDSFSKLFRTLADEAGLPRIRLHDLRHGFASMALRAGVHPKVVSDRLGHSEVGITLNIYSHVTPEVDRAASETVAALIARGTS
jgi:integrase